MGDKSIPPVFDGGRSLRHRFNTGFVTFSSHNTALRYLYLIRGNQVNNALMKIIMIYRLTTSFKIGRKE
jgi:hypothetical protein